MGIALLAHRLQMAWQGYIDNNLCGAGLAQAAITGHDGSVWAKSGGFNASAAELQAMATLVGNPAKGMSHMYGGEKFQVLQNPPSGDLVYSKNGATGFCIVKTTQAVIMGFYDDKLQPGQANNIVHGIADYLKNSGY